MNWEVGAGQCSVKSKNAGISLPVYAMAALGVVMENANSPWPPRLALPQTFCGSIPLFSSDRTLGGVGGNDVEDALAELGDFGVADAVDGEEFGFGGGFFGGEMLEGFVAEDDVAGHAFGFGGGLSPIAKFFQQDSIDITEWFFHAGCVWRFWPGHFEAGGIAHHVLAFGGEGE